MSDDYRPCVGVALFNARGEVFVGQRRRKRRGEAIAPAHEWQMPQGGIDDDEEPLAAAMRELREETNVVSVRVLAEADGWFAYDFPPDVARTTWGGRYRGQRQKWFAFRFEGDETEINIHQPDGGHKPEFDDWRWELLEHTPSLIVPFKRRVYEQVVTAFAHLSGVKAR
jgi:putative (di)nucleoside polyphosphate hydrolase